MNYEIQSLEDKKIICNIIYVAILVGVFIVLAVGNGLSSIILLLLLAVCAVINTVYKKKLDQKIDDCKRSKYARESAYNREVDRRYEESCRLMGCPEKPIIIAGNPIWVYEGIFYEAETRYDYKQVYERKRMSYIDNTKEMPWNTVDCKKIPVRDIQYFAKEGDVQYTTQISGGGGGGSSISGAIIGGIIAGEAGAVIGSRKKINEIKTTTQTHDSRRTVIRYYEGEAIKTINYDGFKVYDYLLQSIPEKDLLSIQLKERECVSEIVSEPQDDLEKPMIQEASVMSLKSRLEQLQELKDSGLITDDEYLQKKQEILKDL